VIEDIGRIVKIDSDQAYVKVERISACASCGLQEAEELAAGGKVVFGAYIRFNPRICFPQPK
jgi:positive regulator of sigma E activity